MERTSDVVSFYVEQHVFAALASPDPLDIVEEEKYRAIYNFYVRNVSYKLFFIFMLWGMTLDFIFSESFFRK